MKNTLRIAGIILFLCVIYRAQAQAFNSIFYEGVWAKFSVEKNAVYKIDYETLKKAGFNPDAIDPRNIRLYGAPVGMLPQAISVPRISSPVELAIFVSGENDGKFNSNDFILFYGQGPDKVEFNPQKNIFAYENNLFTDKNFYFLTVASESGKRILKGTTAGNGLPQISEYIDYGYYETDSYNDLKSGREWFGELFDTRLEITIRFAMEGIVPNSEIKVVSNVMAQSYTEPGFKMFWNDNPVLDRKMQTIPETQYGVKGRIGVDTLILDANTVGAIGVINQDIKYQYTKGASGRSVGYLNYVLLNVKRKIAWYGNPTFFTVPPSEEASEILFSSAPAGMTVWDVTDPFNAEEQNVVGETSASFVSESVSTKDFVAFTASELLVPTFEGAVPNQNLQGESTPDLLIVTHPDFRTEADRLASHRRQVYDIDVRVVSTEEIYNEFSGGRQDITAIRDFVRFLCGINPSKLKNLLLFGRGSYDYKKRVFNNSNYVPTYESRNSLSPLETYSSDDYFGFLEDNEGEWNESPAKNHTLDIGVGRLPVRSLKDATAIVDKLIAYDNSPARYAGWRQEILFVADDGDFNIHQGQADELAEDIENDYSGYNTDKIYLDDFEQEDKPSGQVSPDAADALNRKINKGFAIVNFTGHGSEQVWMQERILDSSTPSQLTNNPQQPLFVTATCEFGRNDDPLLISTAELLLFRKSGGAIGLVTTTRPVNSGTNFSLNKAFYSSFFNSENGAKDIGTIFMETKNKSMSGVANRNFSLLGDPSLRFGPPSENVVVTKVATLNGSDTLKALSTVVVEGEIRSGANLSADFNGTIELELFDKRSSRQTLGDENAPFSYQVWNHTLFRGNATVENGIFAVEMILPMNLASEIGKGKLALYAFTDDKEREALGTSTDFKVGSLDESPGTDNLGPFIELFMGDTTFVNGGYTNSDTKLVGRLSDKSGINISGYDPTNLIATLDDLETFIVNDYFVADKDDYTQGTFSFPIYDLPEGNHTITFQAWDNYNNITTASINFVVGEEGRLVIEELSNYPNPFAESTIIQFTHNRSGEDLEARVLIYDIMGQLADDRQFTIAASPYRVTLCEWNGKNTLETKMSSGIYLVKVLVRSLSDGAKNDKIAKLILVN